MKEKPEHQIEVSAMTMADGLVIQKVDRALREAVVDIHDINKPLDKKRQVILTFNLVPEKTKDEHGRLGISLSAKVKTNLADKFGTETIIVTGEKSDGTLVARENYQSSILDDMDIDEDEEPSNVTKISEGANQ